MSEFFLSVVNMSISASWIVLAVLLIRALFKKAPKWFTVLLWSIVGIRLISPFSYESVLSLIPSVETISPEIMLDRTPEINTGIPIINNAVNPVITGSFAPEPLTSANPLQILIPILAVVWFLGIAVMLLYTVISYCHVKYKVRTAVLLRDDIFQSERVVSPFVLGIIKPKIYLPFSISEEDITHVIAHEEAHIRRKDHWWKPLGFLILTVHWFNPLMWLGYVLLCRDIEFACDEKVVKELGDEQKADYSRALLSCSVNRRLITACPLAFGEVGVKDRIRSVLNYKKPAFWIIILSVIVVIVMSICFLTDPITVKLKNIEDLSLDSTIEETISVFAYDVNENYKSIGPVSKDLLQDLSNIRISRKEISLNRSTDRDSSHTLILHEEPDEEDIMLSYVKGLYIHFNYDFTSVWVDTGVKPTLSYKVIDPENAKEIYDYIFNYNVSVSAVGGADIDIPEDVMDAVFSEPPKMIVISNDQNVEALKGTSSWTYYGNDGDAISINSDSSHPLALKEYMPSLNLYVSHSESLGARIQFNAKGESSVCELPPDEVYISCWPESDWGKVGDVSEETVETEVDDSGNYFFNLKNGNYIYEVVAEWNSTEQYNGTVRYSFYTVRFDIDPNSYPKLGEGARVKETYTQTPSDRIDEAYDNEELVITKTHYMMEDGLWATEDHAYRYRLEISGRMHNAAKNTTYIVLSNKKDITFEETWKASGFSSILSDYFDPGDAVIVAYKSY